MISRATLALMAAAAPLATEAMRPAPGSALGLVQDTMRHLTTFKMETGGEEMDDDEMDDDEMEDMPMEDMPMEDMPMEDSDGGVANASTEAATPVPAEEVPAEECSTIAQLAETTPDLSTLFTAVSAAPSVAADLSTLTEEFTVFAPNNDAFALIPPEPLAALLNLTDVLTFLLEVHVVPGAVYAEDLMDGDVLETVNGGNLTVAINDGTVYITAPGEGGTMGTVLLPDVEACNGVVHIIDSVLLPGAPPSEGADPAPAMTPMSDPVTPVVEPIVTTTPPMPEPAPMPAVTPVVRVAEPVTDPAPVPVTEPAPEPEVVEAIPPVTPPPPPPPTKTADGEFVFALCIQGESQNFGPIEGEDGVKRGEGVTITSAGTCSWQEFAGGFDGYPSRGIDDGHEKGMDEAIKEMFPGDFDKQTAFLQSMVDIADPVNLDYPQDKAIADGGKRMENIGKLNAACSSLITIQC